MQDSKSVKMGTMPIGKLLLSMSLPAVFSMLIQALYNIVDSIYVAYLGQDALFAVGLAMPMQMLSLAVGLGCATGTNALVARRLGQKRQEHANQTATTGLALSVIHSVVLMVIGVLFSEAFLKLFTNDPEIIRMGTDYLRVVLIFSLGQQVQIVAERILQSTGNMIVPMVSLLISAITNIILDPIFIFGYFGVPKMGVMGAAIATVIGQWVGMIYIVYVLIKKNHDIKIQLEKFKFEPVVVKKIYRIGLPTMIMNAVGSFTITLMNGILVGYGQVAVNALSIYFKVQSFVFMPIFGMNQGSMPILSYNFGAQNKKRYLDTLKLKLIVAIMIMFSGTLLFSFAPTLILGMFQPTEELITVGVKALRTISLGFVFAAISIVMTTAFQSLGHGVKSMVMSLSRQLIFLVPLAYVLGKIGGLNLIWFAYPIAEVLVVILFIPSCLKAIHSSFKPKPAN